MDCFTLGGEVIMNCIVCEQPLAEDWSSAPIHFDSCDKCIYCNETVQFSDIQKLAQLRAGVPSNDKFSVYHPYCKSEALERDFKQRTVVITQEHLDMLNSANLMFKANLHLSVESNQQEAEIRSREWIFQMSLEEKFIVLRRMEAVTAMLSIALSKDKQKIQVKLDELKRVGLKDLQQAEERIEIEKERIAKRKREEMKLSPAARAREKSITAMMAIGMTREMAEKTMEDNERRKQ